MVISPDECYYLGYLSKKQGFKGGMIAFFDVDSLDPYSKLDMVLVQINSVLTPFFVETIHLKDKNFVFLKFEGVADGSRADQMVGSELFLPLDRLPKLDDGEYYLHELPGMEVVDAEVGSLGRVDKIFDYANNPLIQLWHNGAEVLIPLSHPFLKKVDKDKKCIYVELPVGLLDVNKS